MATEPYKQVVNAYLADLRSGIALLRDSKDLREQSEAAEKMCRLSRYITFSLGKPSEYSEAYIREIADLFMSVAGLIHGSDNIKAYRDHIRHRAKVLRAEIEPVTV